MLLTIINNMSTKDIEQLFSKAQSDLKQETANEKLVIPDVHIEDQKYVLIYFVEDSKGDQIMKIWGAFPTQDAADEQAEQIRGKIGNEAFDGFVLEMYGLATRPPQKKEIAGQKYHEGELQALVDKFADQQKKVNSVFDTREENLDFEPLEQEIMKNELKALLEPISETEETTTPIETVQPRVSEQQVLEEAVKPERPPTHFDPEERLKTFEELDCLNKAKSSIETMYDEPMKQQLELAKEDIRVEKQNWALVSFTGKECKQRTSTDGIIFWGVFDTIGNDLKKYASKLSDSKMDIHVLELYTWIAVPPNEKYMKSVEVHETHIIDVLKRYKLHIEYEKESFKLRKDKLKNNPDMNQYRRNKDVFKELLEKFGRAYIDSTTGNNDGGAVNEELFKKVFPHQKKLPKFEVEEV